MRIHMGRERCSTSSAQEVSHDALVSVPVAMSAKLKKGFGTAILWCRHYREYVYRLYGDDPVLMCIL